MATKRTALGKGVGALLSGGLDDVLASTKAGTRGKEELRDLPVDLLQRGRYQPRTHMEQSALEDLAKSIKVQGIIQPIVVRAFRRRW